MANPHVDFGFVQVPRSLRYLVKSGVLTWAEHNVICTLLREARYRPGSLVHRGIQYQLKEGELGHAQETIAGMAATSRSVVRRAYQKAEKLGIISQRSACKGPKAPRITTVRDRREWTWPLAPRFTDSHAEGQASGQPASQAAGSTTSEDSLVRPASSFRAVQPNEQPFERAVGPYRRADEKKDDDKEGNSLTVTANAVAAKPYQQFNASREEGRKDKDDQEPGRAFAFENKDELRELVCLWRSHPQAARSNKTWEKCESLLYKLGEDTRPTVEIALRDWTTFAHLVQSAHGVADDCPGTPFRYFPDKPSVGFLLKYRGTAVRAAKALREHPTRLSEDDLWHRAAGGAHAAWDEIVTRGREESQVASSPTPSAPQGPEVGADCNQLQEPGPSGVSVLPDAASPDRGGHL